VTKIRLVLLATTAMAACQLGAAASHAQTSVQIAQAAPNDDGKHKHEDGQRKGPQDERPRPAANNQRPAAEAAKPAPAKPAPAANAPAERKPPAAAREDRKDRQAPREAAPAPAAQKEPAAPAQRPPERRAAQPGKDARPAGGAAESAPKTEPALKAQPAKPAPGADAKPAQLDKPARPDKPASAERQKPAAANRMEPPADAKPAPAQPGPRPETPAANHQTKAPGERPQAPGVQPQAPGAPPVAVQPNAPQPLPRGPGAVARRPAPVAAPLPALPPVATKPLPATAPAPGAAMRIDQIRSERTTVQENGRTVITEPGRVIIEDPSGRAFVRHDEIDRFRYGARDIRVLRQGDDLRTIIVRPDGSQIINITDRDGRLVRRIRRDRDGREIIIINNNYGPAAIAAGVAAGVIGGYFVSLPPPVIDIPEDRYIVEADQAPPQVIYDTLIAPPVERIARPYTLDEIRYSPSVRERMPSIDLDTINFDTGSAEIAPDQAAKLQVIAEALNRAITRNPRTVFLIEGYTDAVGDATDNLSLSDRRAEAAATLLSQQFNVPAENLTSQGYGEQDLRVQTSGPERRNRRVTIRNITPLLNGGKTAH
jgi:outer membrane protein OmpA-like peptidoglycan-associated protein